MDTLFHLLSITICSIIAGAALGVGVAGIQGLDTSKGKWVSWASLCAGWILVMTIFRYIV